MERIPRKELINVIQAGMSGSRNSFSIAVGRFVAKLKHIDLALAQELSQFIAKESVLRGNQNFVATPVDADSRMPLVETIYPVVVEKDPILPASIQTVFSQILKEWCNIDALLAEGLTPARMLLFCGQPGVGKTLVAHWLAQQLDLPLLTLNLATVMSSYLGKTGNNVRAVFDHAVQRPCVLLLDEFDAIAKRRDDDSDVGELKRLVNVLLQALDEWPSNSLLIAATNHGDLLDPAVWRRFDHVLTFEKPDIDLISQFLSELPMEEKVRANLAALLVGESFSSIQQLIRSSRKMALLDQVDLVRAMVMNAIHLRSAKGKILKPHEGEMVLMHLEGKSLREIGTFFGKSHPTVGSVIKRYLGE